MILKFPDGFLWGSATSSHQIEGNNFNDWSVWEKSPARIEELKNRGEDPQDFISGTACNSWENFAEDVELLKKLGQGSYRFSIEWSRVEPKEGEINYEAIRHYRSLAQLLCDAGIEPVVTLWHFTNPVWVAEQGGWLNPKISEKFVRFINPVVDNLKDLVRCWVTFNEPSIYIGASFVNGQWPPQGRNIWKAVRARGNIIKTHIRTYQEIKKIYAPLQLDQVDHDDQPQKSFSGPTSHNSIFKQRGSLTQSMILGGNNRLLDNKVRVGIVENNLEMVAGNFWKKLGLKKLANYFFNEYTWLKTLPYQDFVGLNYYTIKRLPGSFNSLVKQDIAQEMDWEIYPEGLYNRLIALGRFGKPILITENGIADATDSKRAKFIKDHLSAVHRAIEDGANVQGYFYWSLLDNFEWARGYKPKFGLVSVDRHLPPSGGGRTIRPSAFEYKRICETNSLEL